MARFHFTTADGVVVPDKDGFDFPDAAAAKTEAIRFAGEWLRDEPETFERDYRHELIVTNEAGDVMWVITTQLTDGPGEGERADAHTPPTAQPGDSAAAARG